MKEEILKRELYQANQTEFRDLSVLNQHNRLPELLRPQKTGLTEAEFQVYEDYDGIEDMIGSVLDDDDDQPNSEIQDQNHPHPGQGSPIQIRANEILSDICRIYSQRSVGIEEIDQGFQAELNKFKGKVHNEPNLQEALSESILATPEINLDPNLIILLIEAKIISLSSWERKFAFSIQESPVNFKDSSIIRFVELFIV